MKTTRLLLALTTVLALPACGGGGGGGAPPAAPPPDPVGIVTTPAGPTFGTVAVPYALIDLDSEACDIQAHYSLDGGSTWSDCFDGPGGDGRTSLLSDPGGASRIYVWNSFEDGVALAGAVTTISVRLTPPDGQAGTASSSADFTLNNSSNDSGKLVGAYPVTYDAGGGSARSVATDGRYLYVAGDEFDVTDTPYLRIQKRRCSDGTLVSTFGASGVVEGEIGAGLWALVHEGSLYVSGAVIDSGNISGMIEKRNPDTGALVSAFGTSGRVSFTGGGGIEVIPHLSTDGDDLLAVHVVETPAGSDSFQPSLRKIDADTGTAGLPVAATFAMNDSPFAKALVYAGAAYVSGPRVGASLADTEWKCEKRSMGDLSLATGFATAGVFTSNPSSGADNSEALAAFGGVIFLVGSDDVSETRWRITALWR